MLDDVVAQLGLNGRALIASESVSHTLRANTAEAAQRGAFGVPRSESTLRLNWHRVQWNLRIKDTWGPEQVSFIQRCPLFGG